MLKDDYTVQKRGSLFYISGPDGKRKSYRPWMANSLAFLYDFTMKRRVFWKKFGTDGSRHEKILADTLGEIRGRRILEIACGTGNLAAFLPGDNDYTGTDISPGLLKRAVRRFRQAGFDDPQLYVADAHDLPFKDAAFELCLCFLSLNFFYDIGRSVREAARVLHPGGCYLGAVPVPERAPAGSTIRGMLLPEEELAGLFTAAGFRFDALPEQNGALLYFSAQLDSEAR
jgi:ubiquinone/menaquinone biosynthesis C-methylase UbiE